jgi:1,2-phenylacetyl-CoA epoxidase PaaB subunit
MGVHRQVFMNETTPLKVVAETRLWEVFARRKYEEPLHQVGTIAADDVELAKVYARSIYDEFSWVEMMIAPRDAIIPVIKP